MEHLIMRKIEIDAGHRIPDHASKCKNLHGHRYVIEATCRGPLFDAGEQRGMVIDFGFLKALMVEHIDGPCDHGTILYQGDELVAAWQSWFGKVYIIDTIPTAENLARHWFELLAPEVVARTDGAATLVNIRVWETPNCYADFSGA